jgi:hypothetical protein
MSACAECQHALAEVSVSAFGICPSHGVTGTRFSPEPLRKLLGNQSITSAEADEVWALIEAIEFNRPEVTL